MNIIEYLERELHFQGIKLDTKFFEEIFTPRVITVQVDELHSSTADTIQWMFTNKDIDIISRQSGDHFGIVYNMPRYTRVGINDTIRTVGRYLEEDNLVGAVEVMTDSFINDYAHAASNQYDSMGGFAHAHDINIDGTMRYMHNQHYTNIMNIPYKSFNIHNQTSSNKKNYRNCAGALYAWFTMMKSQVSLVEINFLTTP